MKTTRSVLLILALVMVSQMGLAQTNPMKSNHPMLSQQKSKVWAKLKGPFHFQSKFQKVNQSSSLTETEVYSWSGDGWFTNGKVNYQYQDGKLVQVVGSPFDGTNYSIGDRTTFSYLDGYLAEEIYEEVELGTNQLQNVERTGYGYEPVSGGKNLVAIMYFDWVNGWMASGKDEFIYTDGVISSGVYYLVENSNFIEDERFTVTSENDTTIITYYVKSGTEWEPTERETYPGFSPQELFNYFTNLDHSLNDMIFSYPLLVSELPDVIIQEYVEAGWENYEKISSEKYYDLWTGILTRLYKNFEYWNGVEWVEEERIEIHFNIDSRIDSAFVKLNFDPPALQTYMKESFLHDSFGNLAEIVTEIDAGEGMEEYMKTEIRWVTSEPTSNDEDPVVARQFRLAPAYPNPFNPTTTIQYTLEQAGEVSIQVYDVLGRQVAELVEGRQIAGTHTLQFDANGLSSGIYYVRMISGNFSETRSISLVK